MTQFSSDDCEELEQRQISIDEVRRQIEFLSGPRPVARLVRPATLGDGIHRIPEDRQDELIRRHDSTARAGRFSKFVPASGAASRMFRDLMVSPTVGNDARARFMEHRHRFPFFDDLASCVGAAGSSDAWVHALLDPDQLGLESLPKGLVPFHHGRPEPRTPFDEHLIEAAQTIADADGGCRVHFTVSPEHRTMFLDRLARRGPEFQEIHRCRYDVSFSEQSPATDTIALTPEGDLQRDELGRIVFRPGGHGALIENLSRTEGDLVFVKNIDNVQPDKRRETTVRWKKILGGLGSWLHDRRVEYQTRLQDASTDETNHREVVDFLREWCFIESVLVGDDDKDRRRLQRVLDRPLRVAGVVLNRDEPGGGPFWVRGSAGEDRPQIVETAQMNREDPEQSRQVDGATHFNPVDLVCAVRDAEGRSYDLERFVDPETSIVTEKTVAGHQVRALERPGLWNGAMAGWLTVFVEVPLETFSPVKSVFDLLRPEHQS
ncbi:MAG: DUF4301 family protein [Acidobacteriota bacterium]|nr:DUF4301 family protein [Acidobacteriota bacterium]MDH3783748.1 DUF4301 family protein [Acidobacteriota bacterium]